MAISPELEMLCDSARRLADDARPARWSSADRAGRSNPALWAQIVENGWLFAGLGENKGGFGFGAAEVAVLMEEVGRGLLAEPVLANLIGLQIVTELAGDELGGEIIAAVTEGRQKLAFAYAEPGARFDWQMPATTMRRDGDASILDGCKAVVLGVADADLLLTVARDETGDLCVLIVPVGAAGVTIEGYALIDGNGGGDVRFAGVTLSQEALIGRGDTAYAAIDRALDFAATAACAQAIGAMTAAFDMTLEYVKQRAQFGEPIGKNQALQHRLVDMLRMIKEAEILTKEAIATLDGDPVERGLAVSAAKIHIGPATRTIGQEAVQMHGAIGTTDEHAISHLFRSLITLGVLFGDIDHHRRRFIELDRRLSDAEQPEYEAAFAPAR